MPRDTLNKKPCHDCGVGPGELHSRGCDTERCRLCGGQIISCDCVYDVAGMDVSTMEKTHPQIYRNGPTPEMVKAYDAEADKYGGRLPWTGIWPGVLECQEFGWYSKRNPSGPGWVPCEPDDPQASEDLNRLRKEAVWSRKKGRFIRHMTRERLKELRKISEAENLSMNDIVEIEAAFDEIPDSELRDVRENATASDMLEELEIFLNKKSGSGPVVEHRTMMLMPAAPGTCPMCAVKHKPADPHNQQSMFYQMRFKMAHGRWPTWADAVAHCPSSVQVMWEMELRRMSAWSAPDGVPVSEPGGVE